MDEPVMIVIIAVAAIVGIAILATIVWMMAYVKKRSWRPNYHERGVSMENVNNTASVNVLHGHPPLVIVRPPREGGVHGER